MVFCSNVDVAECCRPNLGASASMNFLQSALIFTRIMASLGKMTAASSFYNASKSRRQGEKEKPWRQT